MKIFTRLTAFGFSFFLSSILFADSEKPLNLLLITVDDMSCDSVGAFGCEIQGTTPVMDRLASQSMRFDYAHVTVGNCNP
ncbi:MAG: heparan N-sulfatase, partial [Opitutae bacterium]